MKDSKNNDGETLSIYRYLMTIARRDSASDIRIRLIISDGSEIAIIRNGENQHLIPSKQVNIDADGDELRDAVRYAVEDLGLDAPNRVKYLGSKETGNRTSPVKCFDFEVFVGKKRIDGLKWLKEADIGRASIPPDEKRILRGYFKVGHRHSKP